MVPEDRKKLSVYFFPFSSMVNQTYELKMKNSLLHVEYQTSALNQEAWKQPYLPYSLSVATTAVYYF
jgi:hypothetical protein